MNKKIIPLIVQLKQNNNYIIKGINQNDAGVIFDIKIMDGLEGFDYSGASIVTLKIQKPDGTFTYDSDTGVYVDTVDPEHGRLKINIPTSCTVQNGMHFCSVSFAHSDDTLFEATSFNYWVGEVDNADNDDVIGTNEYPVLSNLITQVSGVYTAEQMRAVTELERQAAEAERQADYEAIKADLTNAMSTLSNVIATAQNMLTQVYEALATGASISIGDLEALATKQELADAFNPLDLDDSEREAYLQIRSDTEEHLLSGSYLEPREMGWATDTHRMYIGGSNGTVYPVSIRPYIASSASPSDTTVFWVDTSGAAPVIKYYNGTAWVACNTAVFG